LGKNMKVSLAVAVGVMLATCSVQAQQQWRTVDEGGFRVTVPQDWKRKEVHNIDTHCGAYVADTADLEFDEDFLYRKQKTNDAAVDDLKKKERNPGLLVAGEELWHVDWRIADFFTGRVDPQIYGQRRFANVARLDVPYEGQPGHLIVLVFYKSEADLPTVRRVLRSMEWKTSIDRSPTGP